MDHSSNWSDIVSDECSSDNLIHEITTRNHTPDFSSTYPLQGTLLNFQSESDSYKNSFGGHRRSQSYNDTDTFDDIPLLNFQEIESFNQDTTKLLPSYMKKIVDEKPILNNMERYEQLLADNNEKAAERALKQIIENTKDSRQRSNIYRLAADSSKRHFFNKTALIMYEKAEYSDPSFVQNYIDHAKLLDEIGETYEAEKILRIGLEKTMKPEITVKLIKHYERRQQYAEARRVLAFIYSDFKQHIDSINSILEGVLFEIRHGDIFKTLTLFNEIDKQPVVKSGVFVDLTETMRRRGYLDIALEYAQDGVKRFSGMPNNWVNLLQLQDCSSKVHETFSKAEALLQANSTAKVEQTTSFLLAKNNALHESRELLSTCILKTSPDLRWKIYYNAAIIEMNYGDASIVPLLLHAAALITPSKSISTIRLSLAKIQEVNGEISEALESYESLLKSINSDWRIYLEFAMFYIRQRKRDEALKCTKAGLKIHSNNGRLWALRIQLEEGESKISAFVEGVRNAPKSGEVWTEAARIALNPLSEYFNLKRARFFLNIAFLFTPQYIDIFIEMVRLEFLENGFDANLDKIREMFIGGDGNYGTVIYMFRKLGNEFTYIEFNDIAKGVKEDIQRHSKIYARAIARSSFVIDSISNEEIKLKRDQEMYKPDPFAFGLSSFYDVIYYEGMLPAKTSVIFGYLASLSLVTKKTNKQKNDSRSNNEG